MIEALKAGLSFGVTSGIITTLGLVIGLNFGTHSKLAVLGGILTISIADALSDGFGMYISKEEENPDNQKSLWGETIGLVFSKFIITLTFAAPVLLFNLDFAVILSVAWGIIVLMVLLFYLAEKEKKSPWKVISKHLFVVMLVILVTYLAGNWISGAFGSAKI